MIKIVAKGIQLTPSQKTSTWVLLKKAKDTMTAAFAQGLTRKINEDIKVDKEFVIYITMKKGPDTFIWDFSKLPNDVSGRRIKRYIKQNEFVGPSGKFHY